MEGIVAVEAEHFYKQTLTGKRAWDCKQRTKEVHIGVPMQLFLDIGKAGHHEIMFSLREDGFEMDKFVLASSKDFKPEGKGPPVKVKSGQMPAPFPEVTGAAPTASTTKPAGPRLVLPRQPDGNGAVAITGELKQWHKVTLTLDGPFAHERDTQPNPFTDLAFNVHLHARVGFAELQVPGYFAADGNAAAVSAESGTKWRAHLSPDKAGTWKYAVSFTQRQTRRGRRRRASRSTPFDGVSGSFTIARDGQDRPRLPRAGPPAICRQTSPPVRRVEAVFPQSRSRRARDAAGLCGLRQHQRGQA